MYWSKRPALVVGLGQHIRKVNQKLCRASRKVSAGSYGTLWQMRAISFNSAARFSSLSSAAIFSARSAVAVRKADPCLKYNDDTFPEITLFNDVRAFVAQVF